MWSVVLIFLVFRISGVFGKNIMDFSRAENKAGSFYDLKIKTNDLRAESDEIKNSELGLFFDNIPDWAPEIFEKVREKSRNHTALQPAEGRKLKYKKTELKFLTKFLIILQVVLAFILPLGIIASKILSWKAVTLSLMAFMLAKILFVKNLLTSKNAYSITPTNFIPSFLIHGTSNDVFWKRQGEAQNIYPWNTS